MNHLTQAKVDAYIDELQAEARLALLRQEVLAPFNPSKATSGWLVAANPKEAEKATRSA